MKKRGPLGIIVFVLLLTGAIACDDTSSQAPQHHGGQALSDSIEVGYERLRRSYDSAETVPPAVRQMRGAMSKMHAQMHGRMQRGQGMGGGMHERGDMHGDRGMHGMHDGQGMHGNRRSKAGMQDSTQMWEWHQQMRAMHAQMAQIHDQSGQETLAKRHRQMERRHRQMMESLPSAGDRSEERATSDLETGAQTIPGEDLYAEHCASCHGSGGRGASGRRLCELS